MEGKTNSLISLGDNKVIEKIYDDILSNPGKKIGEALGTIINIGNTILWPIKWANEKTKIYFENNLKRYEENLSKIDIEKIIQVPTEISMPILDRFTYVSNEEISEAFINLLTSASNSDTIQFAHPSFIQIIDRLSPDEAKIVKYFSESNSIAKISLSKYLLQDTPSRKDNKYELNYKQYFSLCRNATKIQENVTLNFTENIPLYFDNLISLGLIKEVNDYYYTELEEEFIQLETELLKKYEKDFLDIPENLRKDSQRKTKGMFELTSFGDLFIKSCIKPCATEIV